MSTSNKGGFGKGGGFGGGKCGSRKGKSIPYKNPHSDPLENVDYSGDLESDSMAEAQAMSAAYAGFKERAKKEQKRFAFAVDAAFWSGLCFKSQADRDAFLKAAGVKKLFNGQHIDGYYLADLLGLECEFQDRY